MLLQLVGSVSLFLRVQGELGPTVWDHADGDWITTRKFTPTHSPPAAEETIQTTNAGTSVPQY